MLRVLRRNAKVAWHCPEIRWHIARYYGWHCLHCVAAVPSLAISAVAVALEMTAEALSALTKAVWAITGDVTYTRRCDAMQRAREIMTPAAIKERLGEPRIQTGNEILGEIKRGNWGGE